MAVDLVKFFDRHTTPKPPEPPKPPTTVTYVIVDGRRKRRNRGQIALFPANRTIVRRTYDADGGLIGVDFEQLGP